MVSTRGQKEVAVAATNPLSNAGILKQVFTFLPGHYLFLGRVCKEWQAVHAGAADQQVCSFSLYFNNQPVTCGTRTTLYSAAVASPATARLAVSCGLAIRNNADLQLIAGLRASIETLDVLRELDMQLSDTVVNAAAQSGRLHVLQHLLSDQQCPRPRLIALFAARSGNISMLKWLRAQS
jgi:hypothetical protein